MAGAMIFIARTAHEATGNWDHRVDALYGTDPVPTPGPGPAALYPTPPGTTTGHTRASPALFPTFSIVHRSLPRNAPWAGMIPHGIPGVTSTPAVPASALGKPVTHIRPKAKVTGAKLARVTSQPKPTPPWKPQTKTKKLK